MRYNYITNEFGIVNPHGKLSTYYKPKDGSRYWKGEIEKYGKRK